MAIKTRQNLKSLFVNGTIPTEQDFKDLIDSALIKRDDCFFGKWQPGYTFYNGDVVIYKRSLYILVLPEDDTCNQVDQNTNQNSVEDTASQGICSTVPPDQDDRWHILELQIEDDDWQIIKGDETGKEDVMFAKVFGRIGMGTDDPKARLDITDGSKGQFLFDPDNYKDPYFSIINLDPDRGIRKLKTSVGDHFASWLTNAPLGYIFKKELNIKDKEEINPESQQTRKGDKEKLMPHDLLLMLITHDKRLKPKVGIGTESPIAMLDIKDDGRGQFLVNPENNKVYPEIILFNLHSEGYKSYLASSLDDKTSDFTTDAPQGFRFNKGKGWEASTQKIVRAENWMTINGKGNVGIGTEDPASKLEVTDQKSGSFHLGLNKTNPALTIINLRPGDKDNYLTLGADNNLGIFVTDSSKGFVFRKGEACHHDHSEEDINQGEDIMVLHPDKKVGIGQHPEDYELDVYGKIKSFSAYLYTDRKKINKTGDVKDVLEKLKILNPIRFKWDEKPTNCAGEGNQIGFYAHEVADAFPELVRTHEDATQAVAYANMVAILTQAIKEQQKMIEEQNKRIDELEHKIKGRAH